MAVPELVVFDVNETLSDLNQLQGRFGEIGAPPELLGAWFPTVLRDGFALAASGGYAEFKEVATGNLRGQLSRIEGLRDDPEKAAEYVVAGTSEIDLHPDVAAGLKVIADAGVGMVTLTVGPAANSQNLLERAGLDRLFGRHFSVDEVGRWKPAPEPYLHATHECGVPPDRCILVAAHPWDIDGARRAGLRAAWLNRDEAQYPEFFEQPEATASSLPELAAAFLN